MKFFEMLVGQKKYSSEQIAQEIIELEDRLPAFSSAIELAREKSISLRQARLGGGKVNNGEAMRANDDLKEAEIDLLAAKKSIQDLNEKLREAIKDELLLARKQSDAEREVLKLEKKELKDEFIKTAARLNSISIQMEGENRSLFFFAFEGKEKEDFNEALSELVNNHPQETYKDKERVWYQKRGLIDRHNIDVIVSEIFTRIKGR